MIYFLNFAISYGCCCMKQSLSKSAFSEGVDYVTSFSLPFSVLSLWDWPLTWKTIILQCYYTVGWAI